MRNRTMLCTMFMFAGAGPALADVTYTSQIRTLDVEAVSSTVAEDFRSAAGFGPWNEFISVTAAGVPPQGDSSAYASQNSSMTDAGIFMSGSCRAVDGYLGGGAGGGVGTSTLDVMFDITGGATPWTFAATGETGQSSYITVKFERVSPSPAVLYQNHGISQLPPWFASGSLSDGSYRFTATARGSTPGLGTGSARIDYTFTLTIPGPGSAAVLAAAGLPLLRRRRDA